jgi:hypothetical protein
MTARHPTRKQRKPQKCRHVRLACPCGYIIRASRKTIAEKGVPTCPCGFTFQADSSKC